MVVILGSAGDYLTEMPCRRLINSGFHLLLTPCGTRGNGCLWRAASDLRDISNLFNRPLNRSTYQFRRRDIPGGTGAKLVERPGLFYH